MDRNCNNDLIGLFGLIHFPNLALAKLNVRALSAKEIYGSHMFQPSHEFVVLPNRITCEEVS